MSFGSDWAGKRTNTPSHHSILCFAQIVLPLDEETVLLAMAFEAIYKVVIGPRYGIAAPQSGLRSSGVPQHLETELRPTRSRSTFSLRGSRQVRRMSGTVSPTFR